MAEGKAADCARLNELSYPQKRRSGKKKKRSKKRKTCWNVGNSQSFPYSNTTNKQQVI